MGTIALLASLTTLGYATSYLIMCVVCPWGRCTRCHGTRTRTRRDCRRCDGTGRRVRLGRRLIEHIRAEYRDGTR